MADRPDLELLLEASQGEGLMFSALSQLNRADGVVWFASMFKTGSDSAQFYQGADEDLVDAILQAHATRRLDSRERTAISPQIEAWVLDSPVARATWHSLREVDAPVPQIEEAVPEPSDVDHGVGHAAGARPAERRKADLL